MAASAAAAAVSVRSTRGPSVSASKPAPSTAAVSSGFQPPSGPTSSDLPAQLDALCQVAEHGEVKDGMPEYRVDRRSTSLDDFGQQLLQRVDADGIWQDHCTGVVFPAGTSVQLIPWGFKPRYCHWLELGWIRS